MPIFMPIFMRSWILLIHCIGQILTYIDTDILTNNRILNDSDIDTYFTDTEIINIWTDISVYAN